MSDITQEKEPEQQAPMTPPPKKPFEEFKGEMIEGDSSPDVHRVLYTHLPDY